MDEEEGRCGVRCSRRTARVYFPFPIGLGFYFLLYRGAQQRSERSRRTVTVLPASHVAGHLLHVAAGGEAGLGVSFSGFLFRPFEYSATF